LIQYERRRIDLVSYFEAVRHAQQVQVDEIPLPSAVNDISRMYPGNTQGVDCVSMQCSENYKSEQIY